MSTHGGRTEPETDATEPEAPAVEGVDVDAAPADAPPVVEIVPPPTPEQLALAAAQAEAEDLRKKYDDAMARLRTVSKAFTDQQSEQAAFRERMEARAKADADKRGADLTERFFEPVQNLRRSLEAVGDRDDALVHGLKMVLHQFMDVMHHLGLAEVPGVGALFDPKLHDAIAVMPVDDPTGDGRILHVHAVGYTVKGKTIQPGQVVIGKYDPPAAEVASEEPAAEGAAEGADALPGVEPGEA